MIYIVSISNIKVNIYFINMKCILVFKQNCVKNPSPRLQFKKTIIWKASEKAKT